MSNKANGNTRGNRVALELIADELYVPMNSLPEEITASGIIERSIREEVLTGYRLKKGGVSTVYFTKSGLESLSREVENRFGIILRKAIRQLTTHGKFQTTEDLKAEYPGVRPKEHYVRRDDREEVYQLAEAVIESLEILGRRIPENRYREFMARLAEENGIETTRLPTGQLGYTTQQAAEIREIVNRAEIDRVRGLSQPQAQ